MCTWALIIAGITVLPRRSTRDAADGVVIFPEGPTAVMRPFWTTKAPDSMTLPSPISNRAPSKTTGAAASRDWDSRPAAAASIMQTPQISSLIRRIAFLLDPGRMCTGGRRGPPQRIVLCVSDSSATPGGLPVAAFEGFQPDFVVVEHSPHHPGLLDVRALVIVGLVADRHTCRASAEPRL